MLLRDYFDSDGNCQTTLCIVLKFIVSFSTGYNIELEIELIYSQIHLGSMIAEDNVLFLICYWKHQVLILINNVMKTIVLR